MFFLSPVGGVSEREEQVVADYFQKDSGKHFMVVLTFVDWLEFGVNAWCVGFVTDSSLLARDQTRVVNDISSCHSPVVSGVFS